MPQWGWRGLAVSRARSEAKQWGERLSERNETILILALDFAALDQ